MIVKVTNHVFISVPSGTDINEVGATFDLGAQTALSEFPRGEVIQVDVENVAELEDDEIAERGFEDEYE